MDIPSQHTSGKGQRPKELRESEASRLSGKSSEEQLKERRRQFAQKNGYSDDQLEELVSGKSLSTNSTEAVQLQPPHKPEEGEQPLRDRSKRNETGETKIQRFREVYNRLDDIKECLTSYQHISDQCWNNPELLSSELLEWDKRFHQAGIALYSDDLAIITSHYKSAMDEMSKLFESTDNSFSANQSHEFEKLLQKTRKMDKNIDELIKSLKEKNITLPDIYKVSNEIVKRYCKQRGERMDSIIEEKSAGRMGQEWIDKKFDIFYGFCVKKLEEMEPSDRKDIEELVEEGIADGKADEYVYVAGWPRTPNNEKNLKDDPPYRFFVNRQKRVIIGLYTFADREQEWADEHLKEKDLDLEKWGLEDLLKKSGLKKPPEEFLKRLPASDILARLVKLVEAPFPVRKLIGVRIQEERTCQGLSACNIQVGEKVTFSKGDEGFFVALGSRIGEMNAFALHQNPQVFGRREWTNIDVCMEDEMIYGCSEVEYMMWHANGLEE
jgi:hypothetical protein